MEGNGRRLTYKIVLDFVILMCVGFPILGFYLFGKPYKRGFFCDDETIRHPFKPSTVPSWSLYLIGLGLPITVMCITEFLNHANGSTRRIAFGKRIPNWVWSAYCAIGVFGFGAACSQLLTDIGKYSIGRLRPHFIAVCDPNVDCTSPANLHKYITEFTCRNISKKDSRLSFPSGHSSFMTYTMLYLALYLQARMVWGGSKLLKHALQFLLLSLAAFTCLSRVSDYKHHPTDVLAGAVSGALVAIIVANFVSDLFSSKIRGYSNANLQGNDGELRSTNGNTRSPI